MDRVTKNKTRYATETLVRGADGTFAYSIPKLHDGETQIVFTVQVKGKKPVDGTADFTDDLTTEKKYMITVFRNRTDKYDMPNVAESSTIRIEGTGILDNHVFATIPDFDPEINFYYVNLPYEAQNVELCAQSGVFDQIIGANKTQASYTM